MGSEDEGSETSGDGFETMPGVVKTGGKLKGHRELIIFVLRVRGCPFSLSSMLRLWSDRRRRRGVAARRIDGEQRDLWRDFRFQKAVWFVCSSLPNGRTYALCWG